MKYKLIKEYPGSPILGTVHSGALLFNTTYGCLKLELYPEFWEEVKEPILTTEDGVDLYEGDRVYFYINIITKSSILDTKLMSFPPSKDFKYFSTKEAAEDYVKLNKPVFSRKDLLDFIKIHTWTEMHYGEKVVEISYNHWLKFIHNENK